MDTSTEDAPDAGHEPDGQAPVGARKEIASPAVIPRATPTGGTLASHGSSNEGHGYPRSLATDVSGPSGLSKRFQEVTDSLVDQLQGMLRF